MSENIENDDLTRSVVILGPDAEISHYRIIRKLGAGGMGDVYLAHDHSLNRQVALKFLSPNLSLDTVFRERFFREARLAGGINHPNIIIVYEVAESDGWIFIALEYVEGSSIRELIDKHELSVDTCLDITMQICDGLISAHKSKLTHRDIKPANIIIDPSQRVRILDFGLAKSEQDIQLTKVGMTIGTVSYMSPEQGQGQESDHRGDLFSLGVVFYEMLTGRLPFKAANIPATLYAIVNEQPTPLRKINPNIPEALQAIIDKILAKKPDDRYQSADALKNDIAQLREPTVPANSLVLESALIQPVVKSLAVMYLKNIGSPDDEYLSYGLTEDIIVDLTRVGTLRVASMRSIMKYKDSAAELEEIGKKLNVGLILDGSIHKAGDVIRISAQLVDVSTGDNLWAKRWEESIGNLPEIKKGLVRGASEALQLEQSVIERAEIGTSLTKDASAYENYLKARYHFRHKNDRADIEIAQGLYSLALKEEPDLLAAKAGLAEIMIYNGDFDGATEELSAALARAKQKESKADEARILRLIAISQTKQSNWGEAQKHIEAALSIHKETKDYNGEASSLGILISILQPQAKFDEAIFHFDRVLEISRKLDDQERIGDALRSMGIAYSRKGDYDRAINLYDECINLAEQDNNMSLKASCLANIGNVYFFRGEFDTARGQYEKSLEISDRIGDQALSARQNLNIGLIQLQSGNHKEGAARLISASEIFKDLNDRSNYALTLINLCQARLTMGKVDQALKSAEKALDISKEINNPLVESGALIQVGSVHFFNREIESAMEKYQSALSVAENAKMSRNIAHINQILMSVYFYLKDYKNCRDHATKALSIAKEIGEKTVLIMSNAGLAAVTACEGLYSTGLKQLRDANKEIEKIGNSQLTIYLKALLGEVLLKHGRTEEDKKEGLTLLHNALSSAREHELAPEIKLIEEILG